MANFVYFEKTGKAVRTGATVEEALAENLNYQVQKEATFSVPMIEDPISHQISYDMSKALLLPEHRTTVKNANGIRKPIEVVSKSYGLIQNPEAFQFIDHLLGEKGGKIVKIGEYAKRSNPAYAEGACFLVVQLEDSQILTENYNRYLLFVNSFDKSSSIKVCFTPVRVACQNTIAYALKKAVFTTTIRHTFSASDRLIEAERVIKGNDFALDWLKKDSEELAKITLTKAQFKDKIVPEVLKAMKISPDSEQKKRNKDRYEQTANELIKAYDSTDLGNHNNTAYKAVQAVADFESHYKTMKNSDNGMIYIGRALDLMKYTSTAREYILDNIA